MKHHFHLDSFMFCVIFTKTNLTEYKNMTINLDSKNYIFESKIFLVEKISPLTTNDMLGDLEYLVDSLPIPTRHPQEKTLKTPYNLDPIKQPVIDVYINSTGGDISITESILHLLAIAKMNGTIIRTTVLGLAFNSASLLAINGTPGFRIMNSHAQHRINFDNRSQLNKTPGFRATNTPAQHKMRINSQSINIETESEFLQSTEYLKQRDKLTMDLYLKNTYLKPQEIESLRKNKLGFIPAEECLNKGICDWVMTPQGTLIKGKTVKSK